MWVHGTLAAKTRHIAIACGITAQDVVHVAVSINQIVLIARYHIGIHQRSGLVGTLLREAAPEEVALLIPIGCMEG